MWDIYSAVSGYQSRETVLSNRGHRGSAALATTWKPHLASVQTAA